MSMLAEPRSRQKWSEDPRNTNWARDKTKFGYQMLTKMGWSEGLGLGQTLSGNISHIKVKKARDNAGVGLKKSHDDDWISHQDDFNALLSSLNQNSSGSAPQKISSLEDRVKSSKKKILYKKFIKSKDLSNASSHDLACIFGQRGKAAEVVPQDDDEEISESLGTSYKELAVQTVETGVSVADYFAKRMAAMKEKKSQENQNTSESTANTEEESSPERKKKRRKEKTDVSVLTESIEIKSNVPNGEEESSPERKKKKKKQKTNDSVITESAEIESNILSKKRINEEVLVLESGMVKRKKRNDLKIDKVTENSSEHLENIKKKKKKKKGKQEIDSNKY